MLSCRNINNTEGRIKFTRPLFSTTETGELLLTYPDGGKQILSSEGIDYNPHISPDNKYIALDLIKFSNLQITRLFKRGSSNTFIEEKNLSSAAWKEFSKNNDLRIEQIINPRSRVINLNDTTVKIELSGISEENEDILGIIELNLEN
ncbi:MAG: hypothetical protein ACRENO_00215 [Thermodesulfobacteriota bacterium]